MRDLIYSVMTDRKKGASYAPLRSLLYVVSLFYGLGIFARKLFYRFGIFNSRKVPIKVISVGNITLGGTGKTPFVITLAKLLKKDISRDVSVLIRGYGWDEQAMLKKNLQDIPILVREDRVDSANKASRLYGSDTAILDDGFQYWELKRDLNIVLIDSRNPFGNGRLFPRGILRESKQALERADIIVFTKIDKKQVDIEKLKEEIRSINSRVAFLEARHRPLYLQDLKDRKNQEVEFLKGRKVILLSSIGDPKYFKETVKGLGANVVAHLIFKDHHDYEKKDVDNILKVCNERAFDFLVTTEKDAVKLNRLGFSIGNYETYALVIQMEILKGREILVDRLNSLYSG